jgi:broad specificity phosphatase PhoE
LQKPPVRRKISTHRPMPRQRHEMLMPSDEKTILYLIRHGATEANLARPPRIQGRRHNPPLARQGIRQAEATRDFLSSCQVHHCYSSPLLRAIQTAAIIAAPHGLSPLPVDAITECDVGSWEGLDWQTVRYLDAEGHARFHADPAAFGYPGGESFADVQARTTPVFEELLRRHTGESVMVIGHHVVNRTFLAGLLGLGPGQARRVSLDNCGISVVIRAAGKMSISTLNAAFHLHGIAA